MFKQLKKDLRTLTRGTGVEHISRTLKVTAGIDPLGFTEEDRRRRERRKKHSHKER